MLTFLYDHPCKIDFWNIKVVPDYKSCAVLLFCRKKLAKIFQPLNNVIKVSNVYQQFWFLLNIPTLPIRMFARMSVVFTIKGFVSLLWVIRIGLYISYKKKTYAFTPSVYTSVRFLSVRHIQVLIQCGMNLCRIARPLRKFLSHSTHRVSIRPRCNTVFPQYVCP